MVFEGSTLADSSTESSSLEIPKSGDGLLLAMGWLKNKDVSIIYLAELRATILQSDKT